MTLISFLLDKKGFVSLVLQIIFIFDANNTLIVIMKNRLHSCQEHSELSDAGDKIFLRKGGQGRQKRLCFHLLTRSPRTDGRTKALKELRVRN